MDITKGQEFRLQQLLNSVDSSNVNLGLSLLKNFEFTEAYEEDLLIISKINSDVKVRAKARKMILKHGKSEYEPLYRNTTHFMGMPDNLSEIGIRNRMRKLMTQLGWEQVFYLANIFYNRFQKGLSSLLIYPLNSPFRLYVLEKFTKDGYFDFQAAMGSESRKNLAYSENIIYRYETKTGIIFPKDHPNPETVTKINFHNSKLLAVSTEVGRFKNVEEIDLSCNCLKSISLTFNTLKKLKRLDLSSNHFVKLPAVLGKMKGLEYLDLRNNFFNSHHPYRRNRQVKLELPSVFYENNPDCEVLM